MMFYNFPSILRKTTVYFTCECCNKPKRSRTITVENTVNPYNRNADGEIKTSQEVLADVKQTLKSEKEAFLRKPVCKSCEDGLSYDEKKELRKLRNQVLQCVEAA
ncbi:hypothetical protein [Bartonella sp. LJL80]